MATRNQKSHYGWTEELGFGVFEIKMSLESLAGAGSHRVFRAKLNIGTLKYIDQSHLGLHPMCNLTALDK